MPRFRPRCGGCHEQQCRDRKSFCDAPPAFLPARPITQADLAALTERVRRRGIRWFRLSCLLAARPPTGASSSRPTTPATYSKRQPTSCLRSTVTASELRRTRGINEAHMRPDSEKLRADATFFLFFLLLCTYGVPVSVPHSAREAHPPVWDFRPLILALRGGRPHGRLGG
jgi:hypothetical protein